MERVKGAMWGQKLVLALTITALAGCTRESRSPDAIRNDTANATAGVARDAKAVALGMVDGLKRKGPANVNKASRDELESLPGVTAEAIISGRPYNAGADLRRRHVLSKEEYDRIADKIIAR